MWSNQDAARKLLLNNRMNVSMGRSRSPKAKYHDAMVEYYDAMAFFAAFPCVVGEVHLVQNRGVARCARLTTGSTALVASLRGAVPGWPPWDGCEGVRCLAHRANYDNGHWTDNAAVSMRHSHKSSGRTFNAAMCHVHDVRARLGLSRTTWHWTDIAAVPSVEEVEEVLRVPRKCRRGLLPARHLGRVSA